MYKKRTKGDRPAWLSIVECHSVESIQRVNYSLTHPDPARRRLQRSGRYWSKMPQVAAVSQQIWDMKYRLKGPDGQAVDKTIEESWRRVASALAQPERDAELWAE